MSKLAAFVGSKTGPIAGAAVFVVASVGAAAYMGVLSPKDVAQPSPVLIVQPAETAPVATPVVSAPDPDTTATPPETVQTIEPAPVVAAPMAPSVDEVRSEADGLTVIAGRAEPGSDVILFVDGVENMTVQAGRDGAFAALAFLTPNGDAQVLTIVQRINGVDLSADDIILAPRTVAVAAVAVEAVIEPVATPQITAPETPAVMPDVIADVTAEIIPEPTTIPEPATDVASVAKAEVTPQPTTPQPTTAQPTTAQPTTAQPSTPAITATPVTVPAPVITAEPASEPAPVTETVAILKSSETGVEVINRSSAPEVMSNVAIDTISYSQDGDVLLSGRAQSQASAVRVYLDNAVIATLEVDTAGRWRGDLPDVDTGIYTLRVDEVDDEGDVTSRVETPFKREEAAVLAAVQDNADKPVKAVTVQTGATLWAIARDRYGDGTLYVRVLDANKDSIRDPDLIYPGQVFELPE